MTMRTIRQTVSIQAPPERVWETLFSEATYPVWTAHFSPGSRAETDWQEGSRVAFTDESGSGLFGRIVRSERPAELEIEYDGILMNGEQDTESDDALMFRGSHERYVLAEDEGATTLEISCDMSDEYYDDMSAAWTKALDEVKRLAEESAKVDI